MFGFGLTDQKRLIPVAIDATVAAFVPSIHVIFERANISIDRCNTFECAYFVFWSIRLGIVNAPGTMADKYAADVVLEQNAKKWIIAFCKATSRPPPKGLAAEFVATTKARYAEYQQTVETPVFREAANGNVDLPLTETTVYLFMQRVAADPAALNALAPCEFHAIAGTNSTARWARIPREGGHGFHGIMGAL